MVFSKGFAARVSVALLFALSAAAEPRFGPLCFEENRGQFDDTGAFAVEQKLWRGVFNKNSASIVARRLVADPGTAVFAAAQKPSRAGAQLTSFAVDLIGAAPSRLIPEEQRQGQSSYFPGHDPSQWTVGVPHFGRLRYEDAWPNIDLIFHGREGLLEMEIIAEPGADLSRIQIAIRGTDRLSKDGGGIRVNASWGVFRQKKPVRADSSAPLAGEYRLTPEGAIVFLPAPESASATIAR
jgi:hypothetical protein